MRVPLVPFAAVVVAGGLCVALVLGLASDRAAPAAERAEAGAASTDLRTESRPVVLQGRPAPAEDACPGPDCPHCGDAARAPATPAGKPHDYTVYPLHGRVVDAETGEPVPTARVFLWPRGVPVTAIHWFAFG